MSSDQILGYTTGPIPATAAFTSAFVMHASEYGGTLQSMLDGLEQDRRVMMDHDPANMYIKYVPARISSSPSSIDTHLLTGGAYLFTTPAACASFASWTTHTFRDPSTGVKFWDRPIFHHVRRWSWDVVGAHNLTLPARHALSRVQHFSYDDDSSLIDAPTAVRDALDAAFPALLNAARQQRGAAAFWLLHSPDERLIATHMVSERLDDGEEDVDAAVARLEALPSIGAELLLPLLPVKCESAFDRTSPFIQNWLPVSRAAGGVPQHTPNFPALPQVTVQ
ncbi:hypothetical protein DIS24_g2133 [Lasiodiplodia hormozganensis]|uniref:Uncharacterized protein n=1 Tax=Lasiodiplodia hormozganensis TaxID=869390 RepID=A0AA39Z191_9PEZI|nr:hypothetical protein DIS24_g2133 [Lasiodiplodia hormozganensis]